MLIRPMRRRTVILLIVGWLLGLLHTFGWLEGSGRKILVEPEARDGVHAYREQTPKFYTFRQFSRFIRPGWVRLDVPEPEGPAAPLVSTSRIWAGTGAHPRYRAAASVAPLMAISVLIRRPRRHRRRAAGPFPSTPPDRFRG